MFVILSKLTQQTAHFFHLTPGLGNCFQRRVRVQFAGLNALQQTTFKRPATLWPAVINPAEFSIEAGAGLGERQLPLPFFCQRQTKFLSIVSHHHPRAIPHPRTTRRCSTARSSGRVGRRRRSFWLHSLAQPIGCGQSRRVKFQEGDEDSPAPSQRDIGLSIAIICFSSILH